jgi:hypothetical protein
VSRRRVPFHDSTGAAAKGNGAVMRAGPLLRIGQYFVLGCDLGHTADGCRHRTVFFL